MQNTKYYELDQNAQKAVFCVLRMLHSKTGSNRIQALQNVRYWDTQAQDSTIYPDLLQAARATLAEYCINYCYEPFEVIDYARTGRPVTPFSKACAAVRKAITDYSTSGLKGDYNKTRNIMFEPVNTENAHEYGTYNDDTSAIIIDSVIYSIFENEEKHLTMIELLSQGYSIKNISDKMRMSLATTYRMRDKIKQKILDTGLFDGYR